MTILTVRKVIPRAGFLCRTPVAAVSAAVYLYICQLNDDNDDDDGGGDDDVDDAGECLGYRWFSFRMTEYADRSNEELASAFIVCTCQLTPKLSNVYSDHMQNLLASDNPVPTEYSVVCGSNVEFYIRPLITCIDDLDFLIANTDQLVFSGDCPALPSDFSGLSDSIKCYKIEAYDRYPGFVRLREWGEMNYNWKYNKYEFSHTADLISYAGLDLDSVSDTCRYYPMAPDKVSLTNRINGPAVKQRSDESPGLFNGVDFVLGMWCPEWPKEAQVWLNRARNNGWPTIDTVTDVVQNGCHLVYIQHRSCGNDKLQWRFSFSLAEVILLQSWTQTQQIVYHLLRFIAKSALIEKDCPKEDEVLCTYHLKTLMLWTCEEMSPEWWNSSSVISICCDLLKVLAEWLKKRQCPNYFIPEANLFQEQSSSKILEKTVRLLNTFCNSEILSNWFVENYILSFIRTHFVSMNKASHYVDYMLPIFEAWKGYQFESLEYYFSKAFTYSQETCRYILKDGLHCGFHKSFKTVYTTSTIILKADRGLRELPAMKNVSWFQYHGSLLYILHTAYGLEFGEMSWDSSLFVESVNAISIKPKITRSQYHNFPKACAAQGSRFQFFCAQSLMNNLTGSNSHSEFQLLSLMAKQFLRKTLKHEGNKSTGIAPATLAYLAALHFAASEYQEATRLCSAVLMDQTSNGHKETLNAGCLFYIDDVARIVGLCVLQKNVTECNLHYTYGRLYLDLRLSPEVFSQYLSVLSAKRVCKQTDFHNELSDQLYPMDINFKVLCKTKCSYLVKVGSHYNSARQIVYRRPYSLTETKASDMNHTAIKESVLGMLMEYALDNVTSFCNAIHKDFGFDCNTGDCYRALYLYNCCQYDDVLHLCEQILKESDLQNHLKEFAFMNILLWPPLDSFFDRDVQSLLGFHTILYYLSPLNDDMGKVEVRNESTFEHWFARSVYTFRRGLVFYRRFQYSVECLHSVRCRYFLGRHFLAKYLMLRCRIDCNFPFEEALAEFLAHKTNLPFEHIIRRVLLRKLNIAKTNSAVSSDQ